MSGIGLYPQRNAEIWTTKAHDNISKPISPTGRETQSRPMIWSRRSQLGGSQVVSGAQTCLPAKSAHFMFHPTFAFHNSSIVVEPFKHPNKVNFLFCLICIISCCQIFLSFFFFLSGWWTHYKFLLLFKKTLFSLIYFIMPLFYKIRLILSGN